MLIFTDITGPRISNTPPPYQTPVLSAIRNLQGIFGQKTPGKDQGLVDFIEAEDTPESLTPGICASTAQNASRRVDNPANDDPECVVTA